MRNLSLLILLLLACALPAQPAAAFTIEFGGQTYCRAETQSHLADIGVFQKEIDKIAIVTQQRSGRSGQAIEGHQAWVKLKACSGDLVLELRPHCSLIQAYTRGDCQVPGVKSY